MTFFVFGFNYSTSSLAYREKFAFSAEQLRQVYADIHLDDGAELVILSTCNRTECFLVGHQDDLLRMKTVLEDVAGTPWEEDQAFMLEDEEAVRHMLAVTSGMASMVMGDAQILGQVKDAYREAVAQETVGPVLHRLMHSAFRTAKRVVNETELMNGPASVSGLAVSMACKHLRSLENETPGVLVIGAGEMGRLAVEALQGKGEVDILVANRTPERAEDLAATHQAEQVAWDDRYAAMKRVQAVIVASGAPAFVLEANAMPAHQNAVKLVIDIAAPRNADPAISALEGYVVHDLDMLQQIIVHAHDQREAALPAAKEICEDMLADFVSWFFHHQAMQPAILTILDTFESIRRQEIERHSHRFSDIDQAELDRITRSIMQKVLAVPVVRLKNVGRENLDYVNGIKLLQLLFAHPSCDEPGFESAEPTGQEPEPIAQAEVVGPACPFDEQAILRPSDAAHIRPFALRLGTRGSALALWQARYAERQMATGGFAVNIETFTTRGDRIIDTPLSKIGGKGLFTKELDHALLEGRIDFAVHSLKDLPTVLPDGLVLAAISERANPLDAFVAHPDFEGQLEDLPEGARIATSSVRRAALLKAWRPDLQIEPIRGNVDTRLRKLDESDWHGIILAAAGLERLELHNRIRTLIDPAIMMPAVAQGALGIVCAEEAIHVQRALVAQLHDDATAVCVRSERAFLRRLEGGCQVPIGAFAQASDSGRVILQGLVSDGAGKTVLNGEAEVDPANPEAAGLALAEQLIAQGADVLLAAEESLSE